MCMYKNCSHRNGGEFSATEVMLGSKFRLPRHVLPLHYDLELTPDLVNLTFFGAVAIDIKVTKASSEILINTKDLRLGRISIENSNGTVLEGTAESDDELQRTAIKFAGKVGKGKWRLKINFAGVLNDELKGFYRSTWKDDKGVEHVIATTQFEATDARRAFPCFDEPNMKATFKVTLNVPHGYEALSAMRPTSESTISVESPAEFTDSGVMMMEPRLLKRVEFAVTPKMSTYYLAFVVGELACGGSVMSRGTELRFWTIPGMEDQLKFAQGVGAFAFAWLEDYCQTKYIGDDKIDFVAVPDFAAGAMENLGCIIYRMTDLCLNEATATQDQRERVAHVVVHELVHMRFGDDATMDWWDNLWLNESFATLLENMGVDAMFPEWKTWSSFALSRASAFGLDQLHSTHSIQVAVDNPFEIDQIFDLISYEKGCSVLRMLEQFIGPEAFRAGVRIYCKRHHLANTVADDLWNALDEGAAASGLKISVRNLMDKWVFTPGHPLVTVGVSTLPGCIKLTQDEFKVLNKDGAKKPLWPIPLKLRAKTRDGIIEQSLVFGEKSHDYYIGEGVEWVVVNAHGDGFFRVSYETPMLAKLLPALKSAMGQIEQYNLLNDAWSATRALKMDIIDYLKLVDTMGTSEDPNVWHRIAGSLGYLHGITHGPIKEAVAGKVRSLFKPLYAKLGIAAGAGEDTKRMELRVRVLRSLGVVGNYAPVIDNAKAIYAKWKADPKSVDSDVFDAMLSVLCEHGGNAMYDEFDVLRTTSPTAQECESFMFALTSFSDPALVQRSLDLVLSGGITKQYAPSFLASLLGNREASAVVWQATKDNWSKIKGMWTESMVARLFGALSVFDTAAQEADVLAFFAANPVDSTKMKLAQGLEQLRISVLVRQSIEACEGPVLRYFLPSDQEGCISPDVGADSTAGATSVAPVAGDGAAAQADGKAADAAAPSGETVTKTAEGSSEPSVVDNK
jgi:puromycin-sensitive aminopeptidase